MAKPARSKGGDGLRPAPLERVKPAQALCLEMEDHSTRQFPASRLFPARDRRSDAAAHARLAEQLLAQNRRQFEALELRAQCRYDGNLVSFVFESTSPVGAVPLYSPLSGRPDFGLVIRPRFPWRGLGPMLGQMGWRVAPRPLRLPLLRRSERRVPPWVISLMVLERLELLVQQLQRRFELTHGVLPAPKGTVQWGAYVSRELPLGRPHRVPCRFPDLRDDLLIKGMIRWAAEAQARSLSTQTGHGAFIHQLLDRTHALLVRVRDAAAVRPTEALTQAMARTPVRSDVLDEGLQAIEWTAQERGLAGLCDLEGLPWVMDMDQFFEAWVECVLERVSRHTGGLLRRGRLRQTLAPIRWERPSAGTQFSLLPDFLLEAPDFTLIVDAKYKRHFEEFAAMARYEVQQETRESHREDIFQVLAYSAVFTSKRRVAVLVYPCRKEAWASLKKRGLLIQKASVAGTGQGCDLWLSAFPMEARAEEAAEPLIAALRELRLQAA
ncbi:MAG: 5-methylcytosine restriction system specificity protein McrC [Bryobacteraceae bacterium]